MMKNVNHRDSTGKIDWALYIIGFESIGKRIPNYPLNLGLAGWKNEYLNYFKIYTKEEPYIYQNNG